MQHFQYWMSQMPEEIKMKINRFYHWQDALRCLAGNVLVMQAFRRFTETGNILHHLVTNEFGKPALKGLQYNFNVSHSEELVICAVNTEGAIGVDAENIRPINVADYSSQLLPEERSRILSHTEPDAAFFDYWTEKEAVMKASGKGLGLGLDSFLVSDHQTYADQRQWYLLSVDLWENYAVHIAADHFLSATSCSIAEQFYFARGYKDPSGDRLIYSPVN